MNCHQIIICLVRPSYEMQTTNLFALQHNCLLVPSNFLFLSISCLQILNPINFIPFSVFFGWFLLFNSHAFLPFSSLYKNKDCKYTHLHIHPYRNEHKTMSVFYLFMMVLCVPFWLLFGLSNQLLNCVIWIIYDYSLENMELFMHCFFLPS